MTTLVVRGGDGPSEPYGAARTLAAQLLELAPERARRAAAPLLAILGHVVPALLEGTTIEPVHFEDPRALRPALQVALRAWLEASSANHPLLIAIDDFERLDEPSAALMALLAADARKHSLAILASVESDSAAHAMSFAVLRRAATPFALEKLSQAGTWRLLASLFGDTARLALVAARVHAMADGRPRDVMQLTQDLVDRGIIRPEAGIWAMPSQLHVDALPGSATEAMRERARALGERARELARLLALSRLPSLSLEDFLALSGATLGEIVDGVGELVAAGLLRVDANTHRFAQHAWRGVSTEDLTAEGRRDLHARLARWVASSRPEPLHEIQHLRRAERHTEALDRLVAFCAASQEETRANPALLPDFVAKLPSDWYELFEWGIQAALASGRSPADLCALRGRMAGILPTAAPHLGARHVSELIARLRLDSGLDVYERADPGLEPTARLRMALAEAQRRFEAAPERERGFAPPRAVRALGEMMIPAAALAATNYDYELS
ncbi:MAG TPA: hypothetical protein VG963_01985, partial [Polyangiaceae bacterium]|nr:hypothetical protein [Polyangiaceae bacterium]